VSEADPEGLGALNPLASTESLAGFHGAVLRLRYKRHRAKGRKKNKGREGRKHP